MTHEPMLNPKPSKPKRRGPRRRPVSKRQASAELVDKMTSGGRLFGGYDPTPIHDPHSRGEGGRFA